MIFFSSDGHFISQKSRYFLVTIFCLIFHPKVRPLTEIAFMFAYRSRKQDFIFRMPPSCFFCSFIEHEDTMSSLFLYFLFYLLKANLFPSCYCFLLLMEIAKNLAYQERTIKRKVKAKYQWYYNDFQKKNHKCSVLQFERVFHNKRSRGLLTFEGKLKLTLAFTYLTLLLVIGIRISSSNEVPPPSSQK